MQRGQPKRGEQSAKNLGVSVAGEVNDGLKELAEQLGWTKSYLTEQILRNYLELPSDYTWTDLQLAKLGLLE
jgi:predicted DNA-binding protein